MQKPGKRDVPSLSLSVTQPRDSERNLHLQILNAKRRWGSWRSVPIPCATPCPVTTYTPAGQSTIRLAVR